MSAVQESPHKGKTGLKRVWNAFFYSVAGLKSAWRHEDAFRQESILAVLLMPLAFLLADAALERALMIAVVLLVLIVELVNSAIEATVDRISLENHDLAKRAKDMGSAAVCLAIVNAAVLWACFLLSAYGPRLYNWIF